MNTPCCRFCNATGENQSIVGDYVFGGTEEHKFWRCSECDLVYLYPAPSAEEDEEFYAQEFEKFMASRSGSERDWSGPQAHIASNQDHVQRRLAYLEPFLKPGLDLLEIGCSSGFMLNAFRDSGLNCFGVEPSNKFLQFLKENGHVAFRSVEDLTKAFPDKKYDIIVHFFLLEHIRDPLSSLRAQLELLGQGGKIICEVPCVNDPLISLYNVSAFQKFYWSIAHHYYFSPTSLARQLDELGCHYELIPEQRYDLSNHMVWMLEGKPGGMGRYTDAFGEELESRYKDRLKKVWSCDTIVAVIEKDANPVQ